MRILHSKKLVFISKPRCGSTSVRNFLTKNAVEGDVICNNVDRDKGLHPHMSAPAIKNYLKINGYEPNDYQYFTVTRNPLDMLWSYYKYFEPDQKCLYNYSEKHDACNLMNFHEWLTRGHVGVGKYWSDFVPGFITGKNFTSLNLEAHVCDREGAISVDKIFYLEQLGEVTSWLEQFFDKDVAIPKVNGSYGSNIPEIDEKVLEKLRPQFPMEYEHYNF